MARTMKLGAAVSTAAAVACALCCTRFGSDLLRTLAITFGTIAYHFDMRLLVGTAVDGVLHNHVNVERKWFRLRPFEEKLYAAWQVKRWKGKLPTYAPDLFSMRQHTPEEIAQAMCQAEIVHEIIAVLSFLPLCTVPWFGSWGVFFLTGLLAAGFDLLFVIAQRYNRPRILRLAQRQR